jgi:mercuric ion transport protein
MSAERENAAIIGAGVAACAVCCAGPILGVLAAIGLGTAAGFALFGAFAIVIGAVAVAFVLVRRRRRAADCMPVDASAPVSVELTELRTRS